MFDVLSPDGFPITADQAYETVEDARAAAEAFSKRFVWQGFYATAARERIPIADIVGRCRVIEVDPLEDDE